MRQLSAPRLDWRGFHDPRRGWVWPERMNMAHQVCDDWAVTRPHQVAIIDVSGGSRRDVTYGDLWELSRRVEGALLAQGVACGDRVGVLLSQSPLCAAAHIAAWRMGAISVPLSKLFGPEALASRISDSGLRVAVTDPGGCEMLSPFDVAAVTEADLPDHTNFAPTADEMGPEDPAVLIYTSGTTGKPKGVLHAHRVLVGHLPGVIASHSELGQPGDCLWTPADWAWIGGLFDVLMPGLALGVPVVAARAQKFTPEAAQEICAQAGVRNVFFPPTALRLIKAKGVAIPGLRSVASGGEPLGAELLAWGKDAFGLTINEFYGQTECNMALSACAFWFQTPPGLIGLPVSTFRVEVIDAEGRPTDAEGDIAVQIGAPSMMLGYWRNSAATAEKFRRGWMVTGDRGRMHDARRGPDCRFLEFLGREDDVITSGGYRIGPAEIEDCLLTHPDVATVGVVGKPDPERTEVVKAYVVLKPGAGADVAALQAHVKTRLAAHCYPREIEFLDALPMTVTGKVIRKALRARAAGEGA